MNINISATEMLNARMFAERSSERQGIMERLSSGLRINRAADGPSDMYIKSGVESSIGGLMTSTQNLEDMLEYCEARESGIREQLNIAMKIRDLAVRASQDATLSSADIESIADEASKLIELMDNIGTTSTVRIGSDDNRAKTIVSMGGKLDVLWVLDQTISMSPYLLALANDAPSEMFEALQIRGFDLRMAAVGFGTNAAAYTAVEPDAYDKPRGYLGHGDLQYAWGPETSLSDPGDGRVFRSVGADFKTDVQNIADESMSFEPGIDAVHDAAMLFGSAPSSAAGAADFREDAKKVIMLITNEDCNDSRWAESVNRNVPDYYMDEVINALNTKFGDIEVWTIANTKGDPVPQPGMDADYIEFAARAGGMNIDLNPPGNNSWIGNVATNLIGDYGDYTREIQVGSNKQDRLNLSFKSVNAKTSGLESVDLSSSATARTSIDTVDSAIEYISDEISMTGAYINILNSIIDSNKNSVILNNEILSKIVDADIAVEATENARTEILSQGNILVATQTESIKKAVVALVQQHGVGVDGSFVA